MTATKPLAVLILGGYGTFGGRLAFLLADDARLRLLIAGRSHAQAAAFCAALPPGADRTPIVFDRGGDVDAQLRRIAPDIVVDATGPFQAYGERPYRVVEAAIALGIDYMDLADGSDFVAGIAAFDDRARERGVFVLAGVSSFPVLTAAAVRRLADGLDRLDAVEGGIAPSPYARVGRNVIRAIAGYAGQKVALIRDGREEFGYAFTETRRETIAPPGLLPLESRRFALVDVPDLRVLRRLWPQAHTVWMGAAPVPAILHRALRGLAWLVRLGALPSLSPFAGLFHRALARLRWGEHRGGMFVRVTGARDGHQVARSWHLLAEGDDGPLIPSMAVQAIVRRCLAGRRPRAGARDAATDLEIEDYETLFAGRTIRTGWRDDSPEQRAWPLYRRILGTAWDVLPPAIRAMHDFTGVRIAEGQATVERGNGVLARIVAASVGFPRAAADVTVSVALAATPAGEIWTRNFAGRRFMSVQSEGRGRFERLVVERFGPLRFGLALVGDGVRLRLVVRGWSVFGIPMPKRWAPGGDSFEFVADGRFHFDVAIGHRITGPIVRYRGWLVPRG